MNQQTIAAILGLGVIGVLIVAGMWTLVTEYLTNVSGEYVLPAIVSLLVAIGLVGGLSKIGSRSGRWLHGPYW